MLFVAVAMVALPVAVTHAGDQPADALRFSRAVLDQGGLSQAIRVNGVGDVDGDGRADVVAGGDSRLAWFRNPDWAGREIAVGRWGKGSTVAVRDVDGDGRNDVITGNPATLTMVWFQNMGGSWVRHLLTDGAYCHNVAFADLNGDGRSDIACSDASGKQKVVWLEAPVDPTQPWPARTIDPSRAVWGAKVADIDRDGRMDVVAGRAWYRNTEGTPWPRYPYTDRTNDARPTDAWLGSFFNDHAYLSVLDLNADGRLDIVATLFAGSPEGRLSAFLAPADPREGRWEEVAIDPGPLFSVHSQAVADFDGSGRVQIMVGEMEVAGYSFGANPDPRILIYRLNGPAADPSSWERVRVDGGTHEAVAVDLDKDGQIDIVGGDENSNLLNPPRDGVLSFWRNTTAPVTAPGPVGPEAPPTPPAQNLAPNPSFELDPATSYFTHGVARFSWASDVARTGTRSLKIESRSVSMSRWMTNTSSVETTPGAVYGLSAFFKTGSVPPASVVRIAATFFAASGAYLDGSAEQSVGLSGVEEWAKLSLSLTAPPLSTFLRIEFRLTGVGTIWVDDVLLERK